MRLKYTFLKSASKDGFLAPHEVYLNFEEEKISTHGWEHKHFMRASGKNIKKQLMLCMKYLNSCYNQRLRK
jgi:hypothetical protein